MAHEVQVGRMVNAVRISRNLRQADVAARASVSGTTVSRLERGLIDGMTVAALRAISRALEMPPIVSLGWRSPAPAAQTTRRATRHPIAQGAFRGLYTTRIRGA